jgi:anti-sigma regulatory factor (Ser/Thr protein kinase)
MIDSMFTTDVADAERFERFGLIADARSAATTRIEFAQWLRQFFELDTERANDLVLAIYEALANSAEFAYAGAGHPGTMDVQARYDPIEFKIVVTVSDHGVWRRADSPRTLSRGRGIPLMQALSDHASIDATDHGTSVHMEWANVGRRAVAG